MREDLNKVLCEGERRGSKKSFKEYRRKKKYQNPEDLPNKEGMTARYGYDRKDFSENLAALEGLVRKNVGKHWDKFYSELCEVFDMKSVINSHILQHLYDYCSNMVFEKDGELWCKVSPFAGAEAKLKDSKHWGPEYYIHPKTKVITKNKYYERFSRPNWNKEAAEKKLLTERQLPDGDFLRKIDGIWYHVKELETKGRVKHFDYDEERCILTPTWLSQITKREVKKQLSTEELREHGLSNDE